MSTASVLPTMSRGSASPERESTAKFTGWACSTSRFLPKSGASQAASTAATSSSVTLPDRSGMSPASP